VIDIVYIMTSLVADEKCPDVDRLGEVSSRTGEQETDDKTKESEDGTENLDNKNLDEQARISSVSKRSTATVDTNRNTADQVASADQKTRPEQGETSVVVAARSCSIRTDRGHLCRKDNGHDDTVDGDDFAEDNRDQVLCSDSGSLDTTTEDRGTGNEDTPCSSDDRETDTEGDTGASPCVRRDAEKEVSDVEGFTLSIEEHVESDDSQGSGCAIVAVCETAHDDCSRTAQSSSS